METRVAEIYKAINEVIAYAEETKQTNSQWFINFLDTINELSVSH